MEKQNKPKVRNLYSAIIGQWSNEGKNVTFTIKRNYTANIEYGVTHDMFDKCYTVIDNKTSLSELIKHISEVFDVKENILDQHFYKRESKMVDLKN